MLQRLSEGDESVSDDLYLAIHAEMCQLAQMHMAGRTPGHTLQSTALVHEAWMRLVEAREASWASRGHFYSMASRVMRSIVVDHARRKGAEKRGGDRVRVPMPESASEEADFSETDLLDLHSALDDLERVDPERARLLELRYFGGLALKDIAAATDTPLRTVERRLEAATAWVRDKMKG